MTEPNIRTSIKDPKTGITYHIMAYRIITDLEAAQSIRLFMAQKNSSKTKRGQSIIINTIIGFNE